MKDWPSWLINMQFRVLGTIYLSIFILLRSTCIWGSTLLAVPEANFQKFPNILLGDILKEIIRKNVFLNNGDFLVQWVDPTPKPYALVNSRSVTKHSVSASVVTCEWDGGAHSPTHARAIKTTTHNEAFHLLTGEEGRRSSGDLLGRWFLCIWRQRAWDLAAWSAQSLAEGRATAASPPVGSPMWVEIRSWARICWKFWIAIVVDSDYFLLDRRRWLMFCTWLFPSGWSCWWISF